MKSFHEFINKYCFFTWQKSQAVTNFLFAFNNYSNHNIFSHYFSTYSTRKILCIFLQGMLFSHHLLLTRKISQEVTKAK